MDAISQEQLSRAVDELTQARNEAETTGNVTLVDTLNRVLTRLTVVEHRSSGFVSYRVRQS